MADCSSSFHGAPITSLLRKSTVFSHTGLTIRTISLLGSSVTRRNPLNYPRMDRRTSLLFVVPLWASEKRGNMAENARQVVECGARSRSLVLSALEKQIQRPHRTSNASHGPIENSSLGGFNDT